MWYKRRNKSLGFADIIFNLMTKLRSMKMETTILQRILLCWYFISYFHLISPNSISYKDLNHTVIFIDTHLVYKCHESWVNILNCCCNITVDIKCQQLWLGAFERLQTNIYRQTICRTESFHIVLTN